MTLNQAIVEVYPTQEELNQEKYPLHNSATFSERYILDRINRVSSLLVD